ncbi:Aminotransferase class I and II [Propionibacterium ruminifibrarum]|uniref:Aminotransferase n=1 Tax=Propionibacterium ruminifibrarum TaxID=1962131 RepID=A0A375I0Y9_9ACTN|nr:aminotransferase class I/II-fold pyridoxal phosphate-dependent enzyme [Propionibacterium ruminifibrarum]SPF68310.1 Aminotransferase class I and II [Propionibacterium ruminifibrarum]
MTTPKIAQRALSAQPFHAMSIGARARELETGGASIAKLSLGEPSFGAPPGVHEAMREAMDGRPLPYTPAAGLPALREEVAGFYRQRHGLDLDPRRILITAGASAGLLLATALTTDHGDDVVMADPCYPCNRELVDAFGGRVVLAPTTPATRYQLDRATMEAVWTGRTAAVQLATPSNPTGTTIDYGELTAICAAARERGAWRVIDEIYLALADPADDGSPARTALETDPDALIVSSFSKYFGMTGWRLGWLVLPEELVEPAENLAVNFFLCAAMPTQLAAMACFTPEAIAACEDRRLELLARRGIVLDGLERIGLPVPVRPDGAFYVYFDVSATGLDAWTFCERALEEAHVALTPGLDFGPATGDTHVRLSYAAGRDELAEGLERLGGFVAGL